MRTIGPDLEGAGEAIAAVGSRLGAPLTLVSETESTNDDAKDGARSGAPHGALWVAELQTRGRGRQGRTWMAERGEALLFSVLLRVSVPASRVPPIALVAGLAVRDAVAKALAAEDRVVVKWPNDVLVVGVDGKRRKVAGVLVESAVVGTRVAHVVVGIGVNVHTRTMPDEIRTIATSLALEGGRSLDRAAILADILRGLDHDVEHALHRGLGILAGRLAKHDALVGREVDVEGVRGVARGIDPDGRLLLERADGTIAHVASGEVVG